MSVLSKPFQTLKSLFDFFTSKGKKKRIVHLSILLIIFYFLEKLLFSQKKIKSNFSQTELKKYKEKSSRGHVDKIFYKRIYELLKIIFPSIKSPEIKDLFLLTIALLMRTSLSIYLANVKGKIVGGIIKLDGKKFIKGILNLAMCSFPGAFVNSSLSFFTKSLSLSFRKKLTNNFLEKYLKGLTYYQMTNIDQRISNPEQRLTTDIEKWADSLATLYSNVSKPVFDIILFSYKLTNLVGWEGPFTMIFWYAFSGIIIRIISPTFGTMVAIKQKLEGDYRACQSDLVNYSEEIAFYSGNKWEKNKLEDSFHNLISQTKLIMDKRLYMDCMDSILVKYGSYLSGNLILSFPVFGSVSKNYLKETKSDAVQLTSDYVRNSSLLFDLGSATGRLIISYKNLQNLAGYTSLIYEMKTVLEEVEMGKFERVMMEGTKEHKVININEANGIIKESENIKFTNVPIISPNGDLLVKGLSFELAQGINCIVVGPNGCGKSSMFRILGTLWPCYGGIIERPKLDRIFYIPQRPYLPHGTLRDQIIYPHEKLNMLRNNVSDDDLIMLLKGVHLNYLIKEKNGLDTVNDWNDILSGGEKQRIAMARLFYHKPKFAILDECTSSTSLDMESILYNKSKAMGITLFTISHRASLFKFHDYMLKFDGEGGWAFTQLDSDNMNMNFKKN